MITRRQLVCGIACAWVQLITVPNSLAHQQKEAYITLLFNDRTGNLEISHRFTVHDAEHVIGLLFDEPNDLLGDPLTQLRFAAYLEQHFTLADDQKKALPLSSVGHESDGKYFWVYQELTIPKSAQLFIRHNALQEIWPSQINHVNVEKDGWVRSVRILSTDDWRSINLQ